MTRDHHPDRRTVLKTIPATAVGSGLVANSAAATRGGSWRANDSPDADLVVEAEHDHGSDEHRFELTATEVTAGWTTIRFDNETEETHFVYLSKLPQEAIDAATDADADLLDFWIEHVTDPFQWFMDDIDPGKNPRADDLSDRYSNPEEDVLFPPWFADVQPAGGVGLTSGHTSAATTLNLDPGQYVVECYVKDATGEFHSSNGMIDLLAVAEERSGEEPEAAVQLSLSTGELGDDGTPRGRIEGADAIRAGEQTIAVTFRDQQLYETGSGHDVHLVRLDEHTSVDEVNEWMNWSAPNGLVSDGTEPGTFVGGVHDVVTPALLDSDGDEGENGDDEAGNDDDEAGNGGDDGGNGGDEGDDATVTAYVHADLNPGAYVLVSEVPDPAGKGLLETFSVGFEDATVIDPNFGYPTLDAATLPSDVDPDHEVQMLAAPPSEDSPPFLYYEPVGLSVESGDVVQFTAVTPDHTVSALHPDIGPTRRIPEDAPPFSSPILGPGGAWLYRFEESGVYDVYCGPHFILGMVMRIVVGDVAADELPEYATSTEGLPSREQFEQGLNEQSDRNENCEWPFVLPAEVLGVDSLDATNVQDAGAIPFSDVANDLGYEFQPPGGGGEGDEGGGDGSDDDEAYVLR